MKLNLKKCSFGVSSGNFLGHMISQQSIEAKSSKIKSDSKYEGTLQCKGSPEIDWMFGSVEQIHL